METNMCNYLKLLGIVSLSASLASCMATVATKKDKNNQKPVQEVAVLQKERVPKHDNVKGAAYVDDKTDHYRKTYFLYGAEHLKLENSYFDIPVVYNAAVKKWMDYFLTKGRASFKRYASRSGRYAPLLGKILEREGLPRDLVFLAMAESGFHNKAKSWAKAVGPWQFMSYTGRKFGLHIDWYVDERRDPFKATLAATKYLKKLYDDFGSWELAAAAYNAGEGKVQRAIRRYNTENFWQMRRGRYLKGETRNYVPKIMALAILGKNLKTFGFDDVEFGQRLDFETVEVAGGVDIMALSEKLEVSFEEIHRLNPEILRWFTPPHHETYSLRVPVGAKGRYEKCCESESFQAVAFQEYKIQGRGTTLRDIARRFRIKKPEVLEWLNKAPSSRVRLAKGQTVLLPFRRGQSRRASMYADLYERPRRSVLRRREYRKQVRYALRRGKKITNPSKYYVVERGDSLWSVAKKTGQSMYTIIASNMNIIKHRMIRRGDRLVVW